MLKQIEVVITTSDAICQAISEVQETPVQVYFSQFDPLKQQGLQVILKPPSKAFPGGLSDPADYDS